MLPSLYDDERRWLMRVATMLVLGSVAVLPLTIQASSVAVAAREPARVENVTLTTPARLTFPGFSIRRDPFVPDEAVREKLEGAAMHVGEGDDLGMALPPNAGAAGTVVASPLRGAPAIAPSVRAVVLGDPARALVEENGSVRVLGIGDRIGDLRVIAIGSGGIALSDGTHLLLATRRQ